MRQPKRSLRRWRLGIAMALAAVVGCRGRDATRETNAAPGAAAPADSTDRVVVDAPTVIAYLVIAPGAVDSAPDVAVEADDWNYAMATLGDSLRAAGFALAMVVAPRVRVARAGKPDTTLVLADSITAGYVFVPVDGPLCMHRGALDQEVVLATARSLFSASEPAGPPACDEPAG